MLTKIDVWDWYWSQEWAWPVVVIVFAAGVTIWILDRVKN